MATPAASPHSKIIGQRELVVIVALLMSLNALAIDAMLPALGQMATELNVADGNRRQLVVATGRDAARPRYRRCRCPGPAHHAGPPAMR